MNVMPSPADRIKKAFSDSPSVFHTFKVTIELAKLDARNHEDGENVSIRDFVEDSLNEIGGIRSLEVESW